MNPADQLPVCRRISANALTMSSESTIQARGPIVLLGADGMLGASWKASLGRDASATLLTPGLDDCDFTRPETIDHIVRPGISLVINAAAYTDVDGAETHEELATLINGAAVGHLAARCRDVGATLVHYSTDYVFNGSATSPYLVDQPRDPINAYGRSKAAGEVMLEESGAEYLLLRTSWLYAAHGKNFVRTIAAASAVRPTLRVVNDQRGRPTSADQLVETTRRLLAASQRGVFHACDADECTWFEFATAIAAHVNPDCCVEPCSSDEYPRPAKRPHYSVLDLTKTTTAIGPVTSWRDALASTLERITREKSAA